MAVSAPSSASAPAPRARRPALALVAALAPASDRRYLAWHFPFVSADRWRCTRPPWDVAGDGPVVLIERVRSKLHIAGIDAQAHAAGVIDGMALVIATARAPGLIERPHRPHADLAWLERLADGARRWTDRVAIEPPHGLLLDLIDADAAHVTAAMALQLVGLGVIARSAVAATPEAALALARSRVGAAVDEAAALRRLSPEAIGLDAAMLAARGIATLGGLRDRPRTGLPGLIGREAVAALDRVFGMVPTAIRFAATPSVARADRAIAGPVRRRDLLALTTDAIAALPPTEGATRVILRVFRADGLADQQDVRLPTATRDPSVIARALRLPGDAADLLRLDIVAAIPMADALLL